MRIFVNLDTDQLTDGIGSTRPLAQLNFKRSKNVRLEVVYWRGREAVDLSTLGSAPRGKVMFKESGKYDSPEPVLSALMWNFEWDEDGTPLYVFNMAAYSEALDRLLVIDGNPDNDEAFVTLMGEVKYYLGDKEQPSNTFLVVVSNNVIRDNEGVPPPSPNPTYYIKEEIDAQLAAQEARIDANDGVLENKADLGPDGKLLPAQLPALAISEFKGVVYGPEEMNDLDAQEGDWCIREDLGETFILADQTVGWVAIRTPGAPVSSVNGQVGDVWLNKGDLGLLNVEDTSDADKPVSTAQAAAIGAKLSVSAKATAAEVQAGTDTAKYLVSSTLASWWAWIKAQAQTVNALWTFAQGLKVQNGLTVDGNAVLNGTNNTAPNQVGIKPISASLMTCDQLADWLVSSDKLFIVDEFVNSNAWLRVLQGTGYVGDDGYQSSLTGATIIGTGTAANSKSFLYLGGNSSFSFYNSQPWKMEWIFSISAYTSGTFSQPTIPAGVYRVGMMYDSTALTVRFVGLEYDPSKSPNWRLLVQNNSAASQLYVDTGVAAFGGQAQINTPFAAHIKFKMWSDVIGTVYFSINDGPVMSFSESSVVYTNNVRLGALVLNNPAGTDCQITLDFFSVLQKKARRW